MSSKYPDLNDIDYVKPLSKTSKNVDKYFKNSTFKELKDKIEFFKNYKFNILKDIAPDKDAKMPSEKKETNFFVKLEMKKIENNINKRNEYREEKLRDVRVRRTMDKRDEENSTYPGKYSINYNSVSKKVKNVIIKNKSVFSRRELNENQKEKIGNEIGEAYQEIEDENLNTEERKDREKEKKAAEEEAKKRKKKVDSVESLKGIYSFGNIKKGIKFEKYSKRENAFGIKELKERNHKNNSMMNIQDESFINENKYYNKVDNLNIFSKNTSLMNNPYYNSKHGRFSMPKIRTNPQMDFKNMSWKRREN